MAHGWTRGGTKADGSKGARDARAALARQEKEIAFREYKVCPASLSPSPSISTALSLSLSTGKPKRNKIKKNTYTTVLPPEPKTQKKTVKQQLAAAASGARPAFPLPPALLDARTPLEFVCPITRQVMRDPVVAADGRSYERAAVEAFLRAGNTTSPVNGARLAHPGLTPNAALASAIGQFMNAQQQRPSFGGLGSLSLKRRQQQPAYA